MEVEGKDKELPEKLKFRQKPTNAAILKVFSLNSASGSMGSGVVDSIVKKHAVRIIPLMIHAI